MEGASPPGPAPGARAELFLAGSGAAAGRRIAGVAAISRVLLEAARAGISEICLVHEDAGELTRTVEADLARAGHSIGISRRAAPEAGRAAPAGKAAVLVLSCAAVVAAPALRRLLAAEAPATLWAQDKAVAVLAPPGRSADFATALLDHAGPAPGAQPVEAAPEEVIFLTDPGEAKRRILCATAKASDGLVSRRLNRPVSRWISGRLLEIKAVRPGHLTFVTALTGLAMFAALVAGGQGGLMLGPLLFQAASVLDGVDGEIARATFRTSTRGAAIDTAVDMVTNLLFVLGITAGLAEAYGPKYLLLGGIDFLGLLAGLGMLALMVRRDPKGTSFNVLKEFYAKRYTTGAPARIFQVLKTITSRDFFAFAFAMLAVLGLSWTIPWLFGAAASIWLLLIACATPVMFGSQRAPLPVTREIGS